MNRTFGLGTACVATLLLTACGTNGPGGGPGGGSSSETDAETSTGPEVIGDGATGRGTDEAAGTGPDGVLAGTHGESPFHLGSVQVRVGRSHPAQIVLEVQGEAPTPCHQVAYQVEEGEGERSVEITTVAGEGMCAQVLDPRTFTIALGAPADLPVTITVNGQSVETVEG